MSDLVVVTGGAGFIGSNTAAALAVEGRRVVIVDRLGSDERWLNIAPIAVHDVVHADAFGEWLAANGKNVGAVVHMGAISATTETDIDKLLRDNIRLSIDLWEWCGRTATPFVYASSAATYGDGSAGFDDDWTEPALARLRPLNAYGWSKHLVDRRISRDVAEGKPQPPVWCGLKFFNVYGPNERHKGPMRSVALQIFEKIGAGETVRLFRSHRPDYANGGQLRDFVYADDCVAVTKWVLGQKSFSGIYNLGTGKARTFLDLAKAGFSALKAPERIEFIDTPEQIRDRYQYFTEARMDRLRAAGYRGNFMSLEDGVADYAARLGLL